MEHKGKKIRLMGRIDSTNAAQVEKEILAQVEGKMGPELVLDAEGLDYISSAGLRVVLRLKRAFPALRIVNVSSEIYDILDMTGFARMMTVEKACRTVSIEGCEEIGRGANGVIYRIDQDNVVKVYRNADALEDIRHEREVARLALILGIPTAISYDIVRVGDSYGSVFELLNARSFSSILASEPEKLDWCVREYTELLKKIHATPVPAGELPDMRETALGWIHFLMDHLPPAAGKKLLALAEAIPQDDHMLHGDYHTKNLELQNDEVLLIDMDTLSMGHPIFELASIYNAFVGYYELDHEAVKSFQGFDFETSQSFWQRFLAAYLGTGCPAKLREVEDKARILGYARLIRRAIRRGAADSEQGRRELSHWTVQLQELLEKTDTLTFSPDELEIAARQENLSQVQAFVRDRLQSIACSGSARLQLDVAVEEVFVNLARFAGASDTDRAILRVEVSSDPVAVTITFLDRGIPYDPLAMAGSAAEDNDSLGIFMTRRLMDDVTYEYREGRNILTLKKKL